MIFQTRFFKNQVQSNRGKVFVVCFEQFSSQTFLVKQRFSNLTSQKSIPAFNFPKFESGKKVSHVYFLNSFKLFSITWGHGAIQQLEKNPAISESISYHCIVYWICDQALHH